MPDRNAKVLVTGGTGFTGGVLVRRLAERGCNITLIARESSDKSSLADLPLKWIIGDVFDEAVVERACDAVEYVFHVAAAYRVAGLPDSVYQQVHVESTRLLAKHAVRSGHLRRFVHISTVGVHGHIEHPPANEDAPLNPGDIYQNTKTEAELWIREHAKATNMPLTVIRPAAIYGPGDMRLLKVFKFAKLPIVPLIGFTNGLYHLIHVDDLVSFMLCAASDERAIGEIFICGNAHPTSIREMIVTVAARLGKRVRFMRIPAWPIFGIAYACKWIYAIVGAEPPIYPRRVAFFTKDRAFDTRKMRSIAEFQYVYSNESGICATCDWYQNEGLL